ncbi:trypco2 family protein [Streptomyces tricolor]
MLSTADIELADLFASLRSEIEAARAQAKDEDARFRIESVDLELHVAVEKTKQAEGGGKFWVLSGGSPAGPRTWRRPLRAEEAAHPRRSDAGRAAGGGAHHAPVAESHRAPGRRRTSWDRSTRRRGPHRWAPTCRSSSPAWSSGPCSRGSSSRRTRRGRRGSMR